MFDTTEDRSLADRRADATRAAVLDAARELCAERGLAGWSMRDLATRVGLKAPTLYAYFANKHAIYDALFRQGWDELGARAGRAVDKLRRPGTHRRDAFRRSAHLVADFAVEDPARYQLMFQRVIPDYEPSPEAYAASVRVLHHLVEALHIMGVDDPAAVDLWTALVTGLTDQQISNDPGGDRWLRLIDQASDMFCDHVGIPHEGATP
jgi:AcrR family transcriptional regulator